MDFSMGSSSILSELAITGPYSEIECHGTHGQNPCRTHSLSPYCAYIGPTNENVGEVEISVMGYQRVCLHDNDVKKNKKT